jgi:hypothetical protein
LQNAIPPSLLTISDYFSMHFPEIKVIPYASRSWAEIRKRTPEANIIRIPESVFAHYSIGATSSVGAHDTLQADILIRSISYRQLNSDIFL